MSLDPAAALELGTVRVVGTGLLGASVGLGLSASGARVLLADVSPTALALARDVGAGVPDPGTERVDLVVVAAPPDVTAAVVADELKAHPDAVVTDVASVKAGVLAALTASGADLRAYVGSHPMAGRERSGAVAARGDLFLGRPWVLSPAPGGDAAALAVVRRLALALGAVPLAMPASEHDEAVALVSHLPQVAASLVAARLRHAPDAAVALAGQGLRDVTRIAASDPALWAQILAANAGPVTAVLEQVRDDLDRVLGRAAGHRRRDPGRRRGRGARRRRPRHRRREPRAGADPGQARRRPGPVRRRHRRDPGRTGRSGQGVRRHRRRRHERRGACPRARPGPGGGAARGVRAPGGPGAPRGRADGVRVARRRLNGRGQRGPQECRPAFRERTVAAARLVWSGFPETTPGGLPCPARSAPRRAARSSSPWTVRPDRASRPCPGSSPPGSAWSTWTPAPCTAPCAGPAWNEASTSPTRPRWQTSPAASTSRWAPTPTPPTSGWTAGTWAPTSGRRGCPRW